MEKQETLIDFMLVWLQNIRVNVMCGAPRSSPRQYEDAFAPSRRPNSYDHKEKVVFEQ